MEKLEKISKDFLFKLSKKLENKEIDLIALPEILDKFFELRAKNKNLKLLIRFVEEF